MRKVGWEDSSSGPDWIDVEGMMRAIRAVHTGAIELVVRPTGIGFGTGVDVLARARFDALPDSSLPAEVEVCRGWPCDQHSRLVHHCFALLYDLDAAIGKQYKQTTLLE
jgi:hypothetical protein